MDYKNKKVLVCGIARSGIAAAKLLKSLGAIVTIQDIKEEEKLENEIKEISLLGIDLYLGKNPDEELLDTIDQLIISPGIPSDLPFIQLARDKNISVISEIELAYSFCRAPIIGITGTNGKTTITTLIGQIFKKYYLGTKVVGNIGVAFTEYAQKFTSDDYAVVELSSFQLENIEDFRPKIAVVINITPDHLDRHKTFENYVSAKENIFRNQQANDYLILNYDDAICREMSKKAKSKIIFFSKHEDLSCNGIYDKGIILEDDYIVAFDGAKKHRIVHVKELKTRGAHILEDIMAAAATAICENIPIQIIREVAMNFKGVAHRFEFVASINGVDFFNDSKATNPDSAINALQAINQPVILIGGGFDKNLDFSNWVSLFQEKVKHIVVMGDVADKIIEVCKAYNYMNYDKVNSLKDAVELCFSKAVSGDCILLSPACASWGMFDNYEQRGDLFKEFVHRLEEG